MLSGLKVSTKLVGVIGLVAVTAAAAVAWVVFRGAEQALHAQAIARLEAERESRARLVSTYFRRVRDDLVVASKLLVTQIALRDMPAAVRVLPQQLRRSAAPGSLESLRLRAFYEDEIRPRLTAAGIAWQGPERYMAMPEPQVLLQSAYLAQNPNPIGRKFLQPNLGSTADYDRLHTLFHPIARGLVETFGFHDVVLVGVDGTVVYTCVKEIDFGTNLRTGPFRDSGLARTFMRAVSAAADTVHFVDYGPYEPSFGAPAAFIGTPVFDSGSQALLGALMYRIPTDEINAIMTDVAGLGASGETFLLGPDLLMRSSSRFSDPSTILKRKVESEAAKRARGGESGTIEQDGARGVPVLASFAPIQIGGVQWSILAQVDTGETLAPIRQFRARLVLLLAIVALASGLVLWEALRRIVLAPVAALAAGARRVAARDYAHPVGLTGRDELGLLGQSFDSMMSSVGRQVGELEQGQQLLEAAPDAMVVANASGAITLVNAAVERLFGYTREELVGLPIEALVPEASSSHHVSYRDGYIARPAIRGMGSGLELRGRRKDGSLVPVEISLSPMDTPKGLLVVAAVRDISDRRAAERSLKESEERLAAAARGANLGLWEVDPRTGDVLINAVFESQLGYPLQALRESDGKWARLRGGLDGWVGLLHPEDRDRVAALIQRYLAGDLEIYKAEHRVRASDGAYKWILSVGNSVVRDEDGRPLRVNGVHIDVSEMKGLQEDLQLRYEDLQRLQGLRDGLVHMIVHDLRSPLTSVMGYLDLLRSDGKVSAQDRGTFIDEAYTGAALMAEMIGSLLDINRLEAGEMPVDRQSVDLCEVAAEAVRSLRGLTIGRRVDQIAADGPIVANCDPSLIRRVVSNLLGNALKFTPESGSITITVTRVDGRPRVEVADTGPGIPADFLGRVFDKFSQAGEGRRRKRYSTGLGLAFCKLAVEAHGGTIGVSSEVGVGSRFWFVID